MNKLDKITARKSCKRRLSKMRVLRDEILCGHALISKIAPPAPRDDDLAANLHIVLDHKHTLTPPPGRQRTK